MPLLCTVSSLGQRGPWRQPQAAGWLWEQPLGSWVRGRQEGQEGLWVRHCLI